VVLDQVVLTFAHFQMYISLFVAGFLGAKAQMSTRPNADAPPHVRAGDFVSYLGGHL